MKTPSRNHYLKMVVLFERGHCVAWEYLSTYRLAHIHSILFLTEAEWSAMARDENMSRIMGCDWGTHFELFQTRHQTRTGIEELRRMFPR